MKTGAELQLDAEEWADSAMPCTAYICGYQNGVMDGLRLARAAAEKARGHADRLRHIDDLIARKEAEVNSR